MPITVHIPKSLKKYIAEAYNKEIEQKEKFEVYKPVYKQDGEIFTTNILFVPNKIQRENIIKNTEQIQKINYTNFFMSK